MFIGLFLFFSLFARQDFQEINIKGVVEKPKTIYILQKSKISKKILKQKFSFKEVAENAIDDNILKEF